MEVTRVGQCAYIKIIVLLQRNTMECNNELVEALGNNALPYRTVARWIEKFQQGCVNQYIWDESPNLSSVSLGKANQNNSTHLKHKVFDSGELTKSHVNE
ncbi:hypothetical protein TNCV_1217641 [Trichonephila clavipes]|nr:hypothetical protein TNCV_1217641 [Trichonephila clavipes]